MFEFPIDLLIKQNLRSVVFDSTNMGIMSSRAQHFQSKLNSNLTSTLSKEAAFCNLLRSPETIKWLFERPNEYMYKIFENESCKDTLQSAIDESESKVIKHRILYNFIKELRDFRPPQAMEWIAFHHYMYYVYRNFLSSRPCLNNEPLPNVLVKKIYEIVISLSFEDRTQFYVRIVTLLREYVMTARDNYENITTNADAVTYLKCLLSYYSAFCSAATRLATVLSEFDQFMNDRFNINWYCLHQRIFFQYFFMVATVQSKVSLFNQIIDADLPTNQDIIVGYKNFIDDMTVLDRHWELQRRRVSSNSDKSGREESQILQKNWKMFEEITKIMKTNFWVIRSSEHWRLNQETQELEGHFLAIVEDTWHVADRLIAPEGNCICEDCMTAEFRQGIFSNPIKQSIGPNDRIVMCYICRDVLALDFLASHIVNEHGDLPRADLTKSYKWQSTSPSMKKGMPVKRPSMKLCKVLSETMAKTKDAQLFKVNDNTFKIKCDNDLSKESLSKRMLECPLRTDSEPVVKLFNETSKKFSSTVDPPGEPVFNIACNSPNDFSNVNGQVKNDKEPVMKIASEPPIFASNNFSDEMESCRAAFQEFVRNRKDDIALTKKVSEKRDVMKKPVLDIKKEDKIQNSVEFTSSKLSALNGRPIDNGCAGHVCGHKCRKEEAQATGVKKSTCQESCDHQKETKKCDCAYCEVFGSNVTTHSHKSSETRDRLRTRLNQRKEKINENLKTKTGATPKIPSSDGTSSWNVRNNDLVTKLPPNPNPPSEPQTNLCNCSHNKTSCQNCVPINIKVLGNSSDKSSPTSSIADNPKGIDKVKSTVVSSRSLNDLPDLSDIDGLLDFIQGNKPIDKIAMAQKKAAKKARQKLKREQERLKKEAEEEAKKREEERLKEEKRRQEEILKAQALARQQIGQLKKNKKAKSKSPLPNDPKAKVKNAKTKLQANNPDSELMEETIPAMVTIKRVVENNNSPPTVTITLKGSTPDQDKLLYTLVNGHASDYTAMNKESSNKVTNNVKKPKSQEQIAKVSETSSDKKKKKKNSNTSGNPSNITVNSITTKELKVTLAVDKSFHKGKETIEMARKEKSNGQKSKNKQPGKNTDEKMLKSPSDLVKDLEIDIPSLKLPPGITITKVNGPLKCKPAPNSPSTANAPAQYPNVPPVSKSGVIVVDTEKLIQQSLSANANKKNKKKKHKKQTQENHSHNTGASSTAKSDPKPTMVTLKNPIFHTLQTKLVEKSDIPLIPFNEQASITKGENGMVTIRRPRCLQIPIEKEPSMGEFLSELKPVITPEVKNIPEAENKGKSLPNTNANYNSNHINAASGVHTENSVKDPLYSTPPNSNSIYGESSASFVHTNASDTSKSGLSAHDILWGLPGIEITKVNKNSSSTDGENKKSCQTADVSIIPTGGSSSNNAEKFNFDKDDWPFGMFRIKLTRGFS
ncbi:hypothetical protein AMK59_4399 [Oryctes borbonicus]|uniref:FAM193 C-terminal domain-containing protein n=1 Tax=Oryctes borbonicus TaxID=1629725 RepID=A0A0T6B7L1_9SCAR|nr:hypothetical protein AMK59_4399 [Oryctes borbonicus]